MVRGVFRAANGVVGPVRSHATVLSLERERGVMLRTRRLRSGLGQGGPDVDKVLQALKKRQTTDKDAGS